MNKFSRFLIAATSSGSGKTTVTLGLLRALKNRGLNTQPYKCGPDYIDTKFHKLASGNPAINLDLFLASANHVKEIYNKHNIDKDISVTEGVMGLFDGYDRMKGSSAQIAELLDIPVILVINAKSMAYSAAAMLYGFKNFYKGINVVGVIFNFVASESHYQFLKEAAADAGVEALGYLPKNADIEIPSRHLGLSLDEKYRFDEFADKIASILEEHIDLERLLAITERDIVVNATPEKNIACKDIKIAVAYDEAFNFMYHENIEALKELGDVCFFSPIRDKKLPQADFVYLPGGYPELYLRELSENKEMLQSIHDYIEHDGKVLAECGGMMYLSTSITDKDGVEYPMVNIFDQRATMENLKLKLGYRKFEFCGMPIKGHEFHYSSASGSQTSLVQQYNAKNMSVDTKLLRYKNAIGGYTHIYWAEHKNIMDFFK